VVERAGRESSRKCTEEGGERGEGRGGERGEGRRERERI
jgi:hypothetical protein